MYLSIINSCNWLVIPHRAFLGCCHFSLQRVACFDTYQRCACFDILLQKLLLLIILCLSLSFLFSAACKGLLGCESGENKLTDTKAIFSIFVFRK